MVHFTDVVARSIIECVARHSNALHYKNICNSIMNDLQNATILLDESNSWQNLTTKDQKWLQIELRLIEKLVSAPQLWIACYLLMQV